MTESLLSSKSDVTHPRYVKILGKEIPVNFALGFWTGLSICSGIGQQVLMPIALFTFGGSTGVYPVLFICSLLFNFIFWPLTFYRYFKDRKRQKQEGKKEGNFLLRNFSWNLVWIGVLNGSNGILTVFSSSSTRVPPLLQPILLQSFVVFTLIFSKFILNKKYRIPQIISVFVVFCGIVISLIPLFVAMHNGEGIAFQSGAYWALIMLVSTAPAALMNIKEEQIFNKVPNYDIVLLLAWESLFQIIFVGICFWADLIPHFGTSTSLHELSQNFGNGMGCLLDKSSLSGTHCQYCLLFLGLFALAYCGTYYFQAFLMKYASANFNATVAAVVSPGGTLFWCIFPEVNRWIQGPPTNTLDIICSILSFAFILPASWYFKKFDMIQKRHHVVKPEKETSIRISD